jgi:hypothetical protein
MEVVAAANLQASFIKDNFQFQSELLDDNWAVYMIEEGCVLSEQSIELHVLFWYWDVSRLGQSHI